MWSLHKPEIPEKHEFGHKQGRHGSVRPETLRGESHAPPDAYGMPNGPKSPKIRRKTGETSVLGPGPYVNKPLRGSLKLKSLFSKESACMKKREYSKCKIACSTPPIYWSTGIQ